MSAMRFSMTELPLMAIIVFLFVTTTKPLGLLICMSEKDTNAHLEKKSS